MRLRSLVLFAFLLTLSVTVSAVVPQFWENFSQEDLLKGTLTRVSLTADGKLTPAPAYDLFYDTSQPYVFSMVRDKAGNIFAGTGHEGKVYKIDPQGNGSVYYQGKELDVFALALDSTDTLYVGTSPDGKVFKVTGANQATEYCAPEEHYIWSLLFDDGGNLYVGTGPKGIIYKVDKTGKKSTFYDSDETHIIAMARESNGNLLAGTSPSGLVVEINPQGKGFTLFDSPMDEIRSLSVDRFGTIYAAAVSSKGLVADATAKSDLASLKGGPLPLATIQALSAAAAESSRDSRSSVSAPGGEKDSAGAKSAIYSLTKDGGIETLFSTRDQIVYDALVQGDGSVLAASGGKGRLFSIDTAKQVTIVTDTPEEQLTRMVAGGDLVFTAGSNQGKIYKLQAQRAQLGTYESKVLDAKTIAAWGKIAWRSTGTGIELSTRTGNTEKPDNSWSDWSGAYASSAGQQISSPKARFLQWRVSFKRGSGTAANATSEALERVQIAYLQQNIRPQVVNISMMPYGLALQKTPILTAGNLNLTPGSGESVPLNSPRERGKDRLPLNPRQVLQPGAQAFTWKAVDDNDDTLVYSLYLKGEGESDWKLLEKNLGDTFYTLDGDAVPDGVYTLKVVASDEPSNPFGKFLIGELVSKPFVISSATPLVEITGNKVQGKKVEAQFRARVATGRISSAEFSIDGGEWRMVFPVDGIADSAQEEYQISTPELPTGEHVLGIRVTDSSGNTGNSRVVVKIP